MPKKRRKVKRQKPPRKTGASSQELLVRALGHPLRVKVLTILSERTASPKEISDELDVALPNVAYHVSVLEELGLIEAFEEEPVRGALATFYRAINRRVLDKSLWSSLDPRVRSAASGHILETLIADAAASLQAGLFDQREDRRLTRTPLVLDEEGWREVGKIQAEAEDRIALAEAAAAQRISETGAEGIGALVAMLCFELAPEPPGDP